MLSSVALLKTPKEIYNYYLLYLLRSPYFYSLMRDDMSGVAITRVTLTKLSKALIPVAPLVEQKRIVEKCDRLLSFCNQMEVRQQQRQESIVRMNQSAIAQLLSSQNPDEFRQHWQRICNNFDLLYSIPETIPKLRQAILQLAVQGKLVLQHPNDEPASVLLERIRVTKENLIKEQKLPKSTPLPKVERDNIPFDLPKGWQWVSLGGVLLKLTDGTHHSPPNHPTGEYKYVTAKNIKSDAIDITNISYVSADVHRVIYERCNPAFGDILYIKDGATTGIVTINNLVEPFSMLSSVALLKTPKEIYNYYLLYFLRAPYFYSLMRNDMSGVAITRVTLTKLSKALIPVAPLAEQKRIVVKVDRLMSLCDTLEAKLKEARSRSEMLMEVAARQVLIT